MNEDRVAALDRPESATEVRPRVVTTLRQALTGLQIGVASLHVVCTTCGHALHESERIWIRAYRTADAPEWILTECYCEECTTTCIETPTSGMSEALVEARLDVVALSSEQRHQLCLNDVEVHAFSSLLEGESL